MFTSGFDYTYAKIRQQELIQEAQQHRLIHEALKARPPKEHGFARIMVIIGKKLVSLGNSFEERYSATPKIEIFQQSLGEKC